jgi:hypothetical protein
MSQLDSIEKKLDSLSDKIDNHLERLAKLETSVSWLRKHVNTVTGVGVSTILLTIGATLKYILK